MALSKRLGFGCTLGVDPAGGSSFTTLGNVVDGVTGPGATATDVETTVLSDTWKTFAKADIDPGSVSFMIAYDPDDTNTQTLVDLLGSTSSTLPTWQLTFSGSGSNTETFTGYLQAFERVAQKGALITANITIKISGDPNFTGSGA